MCEIESKQTADAYWELIIDQIKRGGTHVNITEREGVTRGTFYELITTYKDASGDSRHKAYVINIAVGNTDEDPEYKNSILIHEYGHTLFPDIKDEVKQECEAWIAGEKEIDKNWIPNSYWKHANNCLKTYIDCAANNKPHPWLNKISPNFAIGAWAFTIGACFMIMAVKFGVVIAGG